MCRIRLPGGLLILTLLVAGSCPAAAQDDPGAWLEVGEGVRARIVKARGVPDGDLPDGSRQLSTTYRLEMEGDGHLSILLPYEPAKVVDPARVRVAVVSGRGVTFHACRVRPEMKSVQLSAADLPAEKTKAQAESELNELESHWTEYRNKAQLTGNKIAMLLEQQGLNLETFPLEYETARKRWLEVRQELERTEFGIRLLETLVKRSSEAPPDDEEARKVREELWILQGELARKQRELGPIHPALSELKAKIKMLESRGEILRKLIGSRRTEKLADQRNRLEVQSAEMAELEARVQELGKLKRRVDAYVEQEARYEKEAKRYHLLWERLQSEQSSEGPSRSLVLVVVERK